MERLPFDVIEDLKRFLREDIRSGDLTSNITIPVDAKGKATIYAKSKAVLAGMEEVIAIAELTGLQHDLHVFEGNWVNPGEGVLTLTGQARILLAIERVSLNIVQRMSGIATKTYNIVHEAKKMNPKVRVAATRKTTPGFRYFDKRAVKIGGGDTHRYALDDMVLIKNNHISVVGSVGEAVRLARREVSFSKKISCEVRTLQEALEAIKAGADIVLLDNFSPQDVAGVHKILTEKGLRNKIILEASGGIDQDNIKAYAESGCDVLSSGALTHSYESSDFNMLLTIE
ncbi:MAG: carboxylating nicotinate-nucleotide diphosphorylase [Candidatus Thorarchaeota archaeon]|nr:carboxylating nicotinate-nucleotide diphosphorylase [Candidatus Thorarchaeota archaeon]